MDLLRIPAIGAFLRWRHFRLALQILFLLAAVAVVLHGLLGPQIAPRNLATVVTAIHWRGLLVVAVIAAGNLFCTGCPMVLARDAGRRLITPRLTWPRALGGKWLGAGLFVAVLFVYELYDLWALPRATAWLVLGYFGLAMVVDVMFRGAAFCRHVCPIGQFNFVASTLSPAELTVRDRGTCRTCRTADCIRGRLEPAGSPPAGLTAPGPVNTGSRPGVPLKVVRRGCELGLFLPSKVGNLDCTLCFDCVHACPHDNIALTTRVPGLELVDDARRSSIGRLQARPDWAVLAVVFTFAGLVSALAMTSAGVALERRLAMVLGTSSEAVALAALFVLVAGAVPLALLTLTAAATAAMAPGARGSLRQTLLRYVHVLTPLGVGIWLAHYGFHLLTGILTIVPATQSAVVDALGWPALGEPLWTWTGMPPGAVFPLQLGLVLLGAAGAAGLVHVRSVRDYPRHAAAASVPWLALVALVAMAAVWILQQPMDMRGLSVG
jgi:ferredoxin